MNFIILACDGLWDEVTDEEAVEVVKTCSTPHDAAQLLATTALNRFSTDNITVVVIFLKEKDQWVFPGHTKVKNESQKIDETQVKNETPLTQLKDEPQLIDNTQVKSESQVIDDTQVKSETPLTVETQQVNVENPV